VFCVIRHHLCPGKIGEGEEGMPRFFAPGEGFAGFVFLDCPFEQDGYTGATLLPW
jgi:hypothetical protein